VLIALKHAWLDRDGTLARMWPWSAARAHPHPVTDSGVHR